MLQRITTREDPLLPRVNRLRAALDAAPLTGAGLPSLTIGRALASDVRLDCSDFPIVVSRRHATITFDGDDFRLEDCDACNGTSVRSGPSLIMRRGNLGARGHPAPGAGGAMAFSRSRLGAARAARRRGASARPSGASGPLQR